MNRSNLKSVVAAACALGLAACGGGTEEDAEAMTESVAAETEADMEAAGDAMEAGADDIAEEQASDSDDDGEWDDPTG